MKTLLTKVLWLSLLPLALAAQGCNTYSYVDLDLKTAPLFNGANYGRVNTCQVFVTGGATDEFTLDFATCKGRDPATGRIGKILYSTFADSGSSVTFTLHLWGSVKDPSCDMGHASTTVTVEGAKTVASMITVDYANPPVTTDCP
jgi:hypothetical protein